MKSYNSTKDQIKLLNRPWVVFKTEETKFDYLIGVDVKDKIINDDKSLVSTLITNTGQIPAKFKVIDKSNRSYNDLLWHPRSTEEGIIAPGQELTLSWQIDWDLNSESYKVWKTNNPRSSIPIDELGIRISYYPINNEDSTHITVLKSKLVLDQKKSYEGGGEVLSGDLDWYIDDAN